jgi:hypothetical protein
MSRPALGPKTTLLYRGYRRIFSRGKAIRGLKLVTYPIQCWGSKWMELYLHFFVWLACTGNYCILFVVRSIQMKNTFLSVELSVVFSCLSVPQISVDWMFTESETRVLGRLFGSVIAGTRGWRTVPNEELHDLLSVLFKVCKSVHHHTFQINQPTRRKNFSSLLLDVYSYVQLNMFRISSRPSSGAQQLQ